MLDGWRLAVGTLTALRVRPPGTVTPASARAAMLLAPLAVLPLAVLAALVARLAVAAQLPSLGAGVLAVGVLALGTRALHLDGLSDTADGLTASYDAERSLSVMRSGTSGPAGGVAVLLVLLLQVAGFASLAGTTSGAVLAGLLVCASRCALTVTCADGVPGARADGLGSAFVGVVPRAAAAASWLVAAVLVAALSDEWWRGVVTVVVAVLAVLLLVRRAVARLGGVTGDVYGASIEVALAVLLVGCA